MESWRERGFVPDSDDEDAFDSQEGINPVDDRIGGQDVVVEDTTRLEDKAHVVDNNGTGVGEDGLGPLDGTGMDSQSAVLSQPGREKDYVQDEDASVADTTLVQSGVGSGLEPAKEASQGQIQRGVDDSRSQAAAPPGAGSRLEATKEAGQEPTQEQAHDNRGQTAPPLKEASTKKNQKPASRGNAKAPGSSLMPNTSPPVQQSQPQDTRDIPIPPGNTSGLIPTQEKDQDQTDGQTLNSHNQTATLSGGKVASALQQPSTRRNQPSPLPKTKTQKSLAMLNASLPAQSSQPQDIWDVPSSPDELQLDNWHTQRPDTPNAQVHSRTRSVSDASSVSPLSSPRSSLQSVPLDVGDQGQGDQEHPPGLEDQPRSPSIHPLRLDDGQGQVGQEQRTGLRDDLRDDLEDVLPSLDIPDDILQELAQPTRRSLRQRNPIQLHPYLLEDAKYQGLMKTRGVKPVRIAQAQEAVRAAVSRSRGQDHAASQLPPTNPAPGRQLPPSSSPQSRLASSSPPVSREFPRRRFQQNTPGRENPRDPQPLNQPSSGPHRTYKRRKISHADSTRDQQDLHRERENMPRNPSRPSVFDIPPSPPRSGSVSSAHSANFSEGFRFPRGLTPPLTTPVTEPKPRSTDTDDASARALPGSIAEEPHDDAVSASSQSQPNSDDDDGLNEAEVRKMRRRMKGVLPASWLRLDLKKQEERMRATKGNRDSPHRSDAKGVAKRGRKWNADTPSGPRKEPMSIMDLADTDEDDDGSDKDSVTGDAGRALANLVGFEEEFHEQDFDDDIPEDNQIDYMLPPVPRGPRNGQRTQGVKRRRSERDSARTGGNWKRARLKRQTRITDPVYGARKAKQSPRASRRPALLDAPDVTQRPRKEQPPFLRVAARQARLRREGGRPPRTSKLPTAGSRQGMGTHAPSRQKQRPRQQSSLTQSRPQTGRRQPLAERSANERLTLDDGNEDTSENAAPVTAVPPGENHGTSVSAPYPDAPDPAPESRDHAPSSKRPGVPERLGNKWVIRRNLAVSSLTRNAPRPAAPEVENTSSKSASPSLFHRSLSELNRDYRHERATQVRKSNMPFDRFLDDNSSSTGLSGNQQTRNQPPIPCAEPKRLERDRQKTQPQPRPRQQRKRTPRRLVLNADDRQETPGAFFQTPEPSPAEDIEILGPPRQKPGSLFGFQPSYTIDFDITPVCSGTFFHESTFLGSGEFSRLRNILQRGLDEDVGSLSIVVGSRNCHWGAWNETVSSELSAAFDLLVKEVETSGSVSTDADLETVTAQGCTLYRAMIKYVTETLSFTDPVDRAGFVIRAQNLVSKLSEHLSAVPPGSARGRVHFVKLCSYNLAFASQIRHIASHNLVEHSLTNDALNLVHSVAGQLFAFVSSHAGLTEIRKFLKDTKVSAYRDSGVRDSSPVEAFVIARHLLRGSDKYDGWLERITTEVCLSSMRGEPGSLKDVRSLETEWRNLFTMLPLNEIDQFGIARIGSRFRESFDNWNLVRRLLSPVLDDYETSSSAQPISYINYCRVVFRRCFHLINDWGWRNCKPVLDTLYDFFAKRTLYNLKHEQSFGSPNFLEDLDRNPSLMVTPRDSCFHILLKIIGSGLRFMSKTHEKKQIRNSAWRLLPNHGRVYPKEMPLREEDLDALRNHHDLLCTLYWAVPDGCRPRLEAIRNLVDPASSHRETIKISLRSWMRLVRFKLSTDEDVSGLDPFSDWHSYFVTELLKQHSHARTEIEAQNNGESRFLHQVVERTISQNQQQIELLLSTALGGLQSAVQLSPTLDHAWRLVSKMPLKAVLGLFNAKLARVNAIVSEALRVVVTYTAKCDAPVPSPAPAVATSSDDDSQEYGDWRAIFDHEATEPSPGIEYVQNVLHPAVSRLVSNCFGEDHSPDDTILLSVVDCWSSVARTLTGNQLRYWDSYLSPYDGDSWTALRSTVQMRKFMPQFLASCIEKDTRFFPECKAQVLGMWMSTLVERASMLKFQHRLTEALLNQDPTNPLLKNLPFFKNHRDDRYSITLEEFSQRRLSLISSVLSNMREHVQEMEDVDGWEDKTVKQEYHELLQKLMGSMKSNYQELGSGIQSTQGAYVDFVHCIVGFLQQHTRDISAINPFFTDPKSFPLPSADPRYIVAKLKSYEPKLSSERAVKALAVFIQGVSERAATDGEQAYLVNQLQESMANTYEGGCPNRPTLRAVLLQCAFPAYLEVAFKHPAAWILSRPILQTISVTFKELLFNMDTTDPNCLSSMTNIFTSIFQATYQAFHFLTDDPDLLAQSTVLTTATTFMEMITSSLPVIEYIDRVTEAGKNLVLQIQAFRQFALFALSRIRDESLPYSLEEFTRLSPTFATEHVHVSSTSSAPATDFRENLRHSASRDLVSYINKNYSEHQGRYYFTRRGGATSQLKEVKIEPAVRAMLENAPGTAFENAIHTFLDHLQRLDLFGEAD